MFKPSINSIAFLFAIAVFAPSDQIRSQENDQLLRAAQREFLDSVRPSLEKNCGDCHWGGVAEGDLDFERFESLDQLLEASSQWKKVIRRVADGEMPPEDAQPISESDRQELLKWSDQLFNQIACIDINPGHITIRRLNRTEYRNTVRDLFGVDYQPAKNFPGDDVGYGFDNIADVLSLPPILLEKYLDAAEQIIKRAINDPNHPALTKSVAGANFERGKRSSIQNGSHLMITNDVITTRLEFPQSGRYTIRIRAFADQAGDQTAKMAILLDGKQQATASVTATADKPDEYEISVTVPAGSHLLGVAFINDFYDAKTNADRNLYINRVWVSGPSNLSETHENIFFVPKLEGQQAQWEVARKILERFASRAFRRPAKTSELDRLLSLYEQSREDGDSFEGAVGYSLQALLVSPQFLFKIEHPTESKRTRDLNPYELATSLSYFLWSTMPDAELFESASAGRLADPAEYRVQIERMLSDPRSASLVENFAAQWLQLRSLNDFQPDPELFPGVDAEMRADMATETKLLFSDVLERDASVLELLNAEYTFINERLAKHYVIENISGANFRKVQLLDRNRRGGLLTQASILTLTSNPTRTSPVKRGKWILENLLGEQPGIPDPNIMSLEDQPELTGTLRERMEQHRSDPNCAACHLTMDAIGFSLEHYDAVGRWREMDGDLPVKAEGMLPDGTVFEGATGLQELVGDKMKEKFLRCFAEKLLIYALGRGLEYYDECSLDKILETAAENDYRISDFVRAICESDPFRKRRGRTIIE